MRNKSKTEIKCEGCGKFFEDKDLQSCDVQVAGMKICTINLCIDCICKDVEKANQVTVEMEDPDTGRVSTVRLERNTDDA